MSTSSVTSSLCLPVSLSTLSTLLSWHCVGLSSFYFSISNSLSLCRPFFSLLLHRLSVSYIPFCVPLSVTSSLCLPVSLSSLSIVLSWQRLMYILFLYFSMSSSFRFLFFYTVSMLYIPFSLCFSCYCYQIHSSFFSVSVSLSFWILSLFLSKSFYILLSVSLWISLYLSLCPSLYLSLTRSYYSHISLSIHFLLTQWLLRPLQSIG